jgi:hypothetical protein
MGDPVKVGEVLKSVLPKKTAERSESYMRALWLNGALQSQLRSVAKNLTVSDADIEQDFHILHYALTQHERCGTCPGEWTSVEAACKTPLHPVVKRRVGTLRSGRLYTESLPCPIYRDWIARRQKDEAAYQRERKRIGGRTK